MSEQEPPEAVDEAPPRWAEDQLRTLASLALLVLVLFVVLLTRAKDPVTVWPAWSTQTILGVLCFGALGGTFSAARSLHRSSARTSSARILVSRAILGALPGLAAYAFLQSRVLNLGDVDTSKAFAIAFVAGFSERLVLKVVETFGGEEKAK